MELSGNGRTVKWSWDSQKSLMQSGAPVSSLLAGDFCCWQNVCVEWNQSCVFNSERHRG